MLLAEEPQFTRKQTYIHMVWVRARTSMSLPCSRQSKRNTSHKSWAVFHFLFECTVVFCTCFSGECCMVLRSSSAYKSIYFFVTLASSSHQSWSKLLLLCSEGNMFLSRFVLNFLAFPLCINSLRIHLTSCRVLQSCRGESSQRSVMLWMSSCLRRTSYV